MFTLAGIQRLAPIDGVFCSGQQMQILKVVLELAACRGSDRRSWKHIMYVKFWYKILETTYINYHG